MGVTITTPTQEVALTNIAAVKADLEITATGYNSLMTDLVDQASAAVETYCNRTFARQVYTETRPAYGGPYMILRHAPIAAVTSVTNDGDTITDYSISDKNRGELYRRAGFKWSAQGMNHLGAVGGLVNWGTPLVNHEEPLWVVVYTAGYLLPADNITSATVSVGTGNRFLSTGSLFPTLLKSGDVIETSGFTTTANNGRFVVTGTPTATGVTVTSTLTTSTSESVTITFQNLPHDVERATIETTKSMFSQRASDSNLIEKQAGPLRLRYSENRGAGDVSLPPAAAALLRPHMRRVVS